MDAVGSLEEFSLTTQRAYEQAKAMNADCRFRLYPAGHDRAMWLEAFADAMPAIFPPNAKEIAAKKSKL